MTVCRLQLKSAAAEILRSKAKRKVIFSGRRFGKTRMLLTAALIQAVETPNSNIFYLAPSRKQAADIAWRTLVEMVPTSWVKKIWKSTLTVEFNNKSRIILGGLDNADSCRGQSASLLLLDEFSYAYDLKEAWEGALLPMLSTTNGTAIFASTPAGGGDFSAELYERAENTEVWARWNFPSVAGGWIEASFVEEARQTMDPVLWRQEFYGSIESLSGAVYASFNQKNIAKVSDNGGPIIAGIDFNRSPFVCIISQIQGDNLACLEEIILMESDTREMALEIRKRYPKREVLCTPDATGARKQTSSLGHSDHSILKNIGGFSIHSPRANFAISDKLNATRLMILDAAGNRRLKIHPNCKQLIRSMRLLEFAPGKSVPDAKSSHGHACDAIGYTCLALTKGLLRWQVGKSGFAVY